MKFLKPKYLALFVAAAASPVFAAVPGKATIASGNDKFAIVEVDRQLVLHSLELAHGVRKLDHVDVRVTVLGQNLNASSVIGPTNFELALVTAYAAMCKLIHIIYLSVCVIPLGTIPIVYILQPTVRTVNHNI